MLFTNYKCLLIPQRHILTLTQSHIPLCELISHLHYYTMIQINTIQQSYAHVTKHLTIITHSCYLELRNDIRSPNRHNYLKSYTDNHTPMCTMSLFGSDERKYLTTYQNILKSTTTHFDWPVSTITVLKPPTISIESQTKSQ